MTVPPFVDGLPHNSGLAAAVVAYDPGDGESARRTVAVLEPVIRWAATVVSRGRSDWVRTDFIADVVTDLFKPDAGGVPRIKKFDPGKGSLETWLLRVLRNLWRDRTRGLANRARTLPIADDLPDTSPPLWTTLAANYGRAFSRSELSVIASWGVRERVEMLCLSELYHKVPAAEWEDYLTAYEAATGVTLVRPFPPPEVTIATTAARRTRPLAAALGVENRNAFSKRWERGQDKLRELAFVADLLS